MVRGPSALPQLASFCHALTMDRRGRILEGPAARQLSAEVGPGEVDAELTFQGQPRTLRNKTSAPPHTVKSMIRRVVHKRTRHSDRHGLLHSLLTGRSSTLCPNRLALTQASAVGKNSASDPDGVRNACSKYEATVAQRKLRRRRKYL